MSRHRVLTLVLGAAVLLSCDRFRDESTSPPTFPESSSVASLEIHDRAGGVHTVVNRSIIDAFVSTLHGVSGSWAYTWHTYPSPDSRVVVRMTSGSQCVVDLGNNWVGSDCGKAGRGWPPFVSVSSATSIALSAAITEPTLQPQP
jgi:hypothetical protein